MDRLRLFQSTGAHHKIDQGLFPRPAILLQHTRFYNHVAAPWNRHHGWMPLSPLAFTMAMEMIIRASKGVVGGERLKSGVRLTPIRAYMGDMTTLTTMVPCTSHLLGKLQENITWARMKINPFKWRSIPIIKGKLSDQRFFINEEPIPMVSEKPFKSLGRCYDASLKDHEQVQQLKQDIGRGLENINQSMLHGKLKLWCPQFGLLPWLMWPLTVVDIPLTRVEKMERMISSYVRKWLGPKMSE